MARFGALALVLLLASVQGLAQPGVVKSSAETISMTPKKTSLGDVMKTVGRNLREIHIHKGSEIRVATGVDMAAARKAHENSAWIYIRFSDNSVAFLKITLPAADIDRLIELSQARRDVTRGLAPMVEAGTGGAPGAPVPRPLVSNGFRVGNMARLVAALNRYQLDPGALQFTAANFPARQPALVQGEMTNGGATALDVAAANAVPLIPNTADVPSTPFIDRIKEAGKKGRTGSLPPRTHVPGLPGTTPPKR